MEEWKINENKVLESLNEIATAKRVATMVIFLIFLVHIHYYIIFLHFD